MPQIILLAEGAKILTDTIIQNLRHQDYKRVNEIADDYQIYLTGENAGKKLIQFVPREPLDLFEQRVRLTQITTPDIAGGCVKPMYKVGRTPATIGITWEKTESIEKNRKELFDAAKMFYGEQTVNEYLTYRMVELDSTDPNSFIVVEFNTIAGGIVDPANPDTKANPYPFEVNSKEAINYMYKNNILQFLVVKNDIVIKDYKGADKVGEKYIIYLSDNSIVAKQIDKSMVDNFKATNEYISLADGFDYEELIPGIKYFYTAGEKKSSQRNFIIEVFEHKMGFIPAMRVGTIRDLITRGRTCVPLIHQAQPYFEKSIKTISEFDITNCLHTFPQKIAYVDKCPGYTEYKNESTSTTGCLRGVTPMGHKCQECHGSGIKVHKTTADLIGIPMPKDPKDMVSLENVMVYKHPPTEILEFQKKLALYEFGALARRAVYNSETFTSEQIQAGATATGENIDLDKIYDTLKPFADHYSAMWRFIMKSIAALRDIDSGMQVIHQFPNDFKMKSVSTLLADLKLANENGAPSYIKKALTKDISKKLYIDQPDEIIRIETKDKYFPFPGKSEAEINYILANDLTSEENEMLYVHFDQIFNNLEFAASQLNQNFYQYDETKQRLLIAAEVAKIILALEEVDNAAVAIAFNGAATRVETAQAATNQNTNEGADDNSEDNASA